MVPVQPRLPARHRLGGRARRARPRRRHLVAALPRARAWIDLLGHLLLLFPFTGPLLCATLPSVPASWAVRERSPDPGGLPRYPLKSVLPVGFVLLLLQGVSELIKDPARLRGAGARSAGTGAG